MLKQTKIKLIEKRLIKFARNNINKNIKEIKLGYEEYFDLHNMYIIFEDNRYFFITYDENCERFIMKRFKEGLMREKLINEV